MLFEMAASRAFASRFALSGQKLCWWSPSGGDLIVSRGISATSSRAQSEPVQPLIPDPSGEFLVSPKVDQLAQMIVELSLLEVSQLNTLLKKKLRVHDTPVVMAPAAPATPSQVNKPVEKVVEKTEFTVKLLKFNEETKVKLIKEMKGVLPDLNLVQAKKFVESAPQVVKDKIKKDEAENIKKLLELAGGVVEIL